VDDNDRNDNSDFHGRVNSDEYSDENSDTISEVVHTVAVRTSSRGVYELCSCQLLVIGKSNDDRAETL
jgi:hypothetical protein